MFRINRLYLLHSFKSIEEVFFIVYYNHDDINWSALYIVWATEPLFIINKKVVRISNLVRL